MAQAKVAKIQLIGLDKDKEVLLDIIQRAGVMEIQEIPEELVSPEITPQDEKRLESITLTHANLNFAIKILSPYGKKQSLFNPLSLTHDELVKRAKAFDHQDVIDKCIEIEDQMVKAKNAVSSAENQLATYKGLQSIKIPFENLNGTENVGIIIASLSEIQAMEANMEISRISKLIDIKEIHGQEKGSYLQITFNRELEKEIRNVLSKYKYIEIERPRETGTFHDLVTEAKQSINKNEKELKKLQTRVQKLASNLDELKIKSDFIAWEKEKLSQLPKIGRTLLSFFAQGWIPAHCVSGLKKELQQSKKEFILSEIKPKKDEVPPVVLKNGGFMQPFESVTQIYGLPLTSEPDPTPYLSAFFILFFALCLTDAGYGIIMAAVMALALKFIKMAPGMKKLVRLLMYGGLVTFVIGAIFGGWFGLTADQAPSFMVYTNDEGVKQFLFQKFNAIEDPISVLILALGLGYFQIMFGVILKCVHAFRHGKKLDAILDHGTWVLMLSGIAFFILASAAVLPVSLAVVGKWWIIAAAVLLVLTQGRDKKGIIAKFFSGLLSLYNIVGYVSDTLSYSRLLALGLATAIIALAVNVIAGLAGGLPYIGWLLAAIIFIGGHIFNLVINALGSFIHSGRLQFVEFFGKFMEGGGAQLKPFKKETEYIFIDQDQTKSINK